MRSRPTFALLSLLMLTASVAKASDWLTAQQWQRRLVLATGFQSPEAAAALSREVERLQAPLEARRISVWGLDDDRLRWLGGAAPVGESTLNVSTSALRKRFQLRERNLHLIGLDGGLKAVRPGPDQLQTLIDAVDSMPMRVREIQGGEGAL